MTLSTMHHLGTIIQMKTVEFILLYSFVDDVEFWFPPRQIQPRRADTAATLINAFDYCMHRLNLLRHYGVKPILVFDGGHLPMKNEEEIERARLRKENPARAIEHESCGDTSTAYEYYQKAVDIPPTIAYE
ncbi:hypothetical protein L2E82_40234 [Cichorium intybus]|uniref:Uncharacterized protein n=1 Tax=Cichorium intybus TaxID=13427 RepID=A0ACB9AKG2_CICIN|nr:hypothetical protein L2E82_40234 [Cichorium intybus]